MRDIRHLLTLLTGALLLAAFMLGLVAAPGFLSDIGSTVAVEHQAAEASR